MPTISVSPGVSPQPHRVLNTALWTAQLVLAGIYFVVGTMKLTQPLAQLAAQMAWVGAMPEWTVRLIGVFEVLGAAGLVLPGLLRVRTGLTTSAAISLLAMMMVATLLHLARGEFTLAPVPAVLGAVAYFIAWGRYRAAPFTPWS